MYIGMTGPQYTGYGGISQTHQKNSEASKSNNTTISDMISKYIEQSGTKNSAKTETDVGTAFNGTINSLWVDFQTGATTSTDKTSTSTSVDTESSTTDMLTNAEEKFTELDVNGDGTLDEDEFLSGIPDSTDESSFEAQMLADAQEKFTQLDVNGDGTLDEDEFLNGIQDRLDSAAESTESSESDSTDTDSFEAQMLANAQEKFAELDVNGDGTLDEDEFTTMIENMKQLMDAQNMFAAYERNEGYFSNGGAGTIDLNT